MSEFKIFISRILNVFTGKQDQEIRLLKLHKMISNYKLRLDLEAAKKEASELAIEYFRLYDNVEEKEND